jgi:putative phosphoribosyl transferase
MSAVRPLFHDRAEAGKRLAEDLGQYRGRDDVIVLGLPRGGIPVAYEVAKALGAPLDVFVVRKLGLPGLEELALGALASGGYRFVNEEVVTLYGVAPEAVEEVAEREQIELLREEREYRDGRPFPDLNGKTAILVDDGLATGASMRAAVKALRGANVAQVVVAVPVAAPDTCDAVAEAADDTVCSITPEPFFAVGLWYEDFEQVSDEEVRRLLKAYGEERRR